MTNITGLYTWTDTPMEVGVAVKNSDLVNENLKFLTENICKIDPFATCSSLASTTDKYTVKTLNINSRLLTKGD